MDSSFILQKGIELGAFLSAAAGIVAALIIFDLTKKFGAGIVATGFRYTAWGVTIIGTALLLEGILQFIQIRIPGLTLIKEILLLLGTYTIVIGTKLTADRLEDLTGSKK